MVVYLTEEELKKLEAGESLSLPGQRLDWFEPIEASPAPPYSDAQVAQAKTELECSDDELAGMEV